MATVVIDGDDDIDIVIEDDVVSNNAQKSKGKINIVDLMDDESETSYSSDSSDDNIISEKENKSSNHVSLDNDIIYNKKDVGNDKEKDFILLLKINTLMNKVIQKCLNMGNNKGMQLIINKTLLPLYKNAGSNFKKSELFLNILKKILINLNRDPSHKFSHIKSLCEELKNSKKVPFITLSTDINKSPRQKQSERLKSKRMKSNKFVEKHIVRTRKEIREKTDIIDLDDSDDDKAIAVVNIEDSDDSVDEVVVLEDKIKHDETFTSNKENYNMDKNIYPEEVGPRDKLDTNEINMEDNLRNEEVSKTAKDFNHISQSDHLGHDVSMEGISDNLKKAIEIEKEILCYKTLINELEEQEVTDDSIYSPYLKSDKYKSLIVGLYKQLCKITGNDDVILVKQRAIRLHVAEGHPPGPVKRLECFLNGNMDETGCIPLPDFHDVLRCVKQSNIVDKLGWNRNQILNEAMALFTQCGNALRKNRQKREYKDLMHFVRDKSLDDKDPANTDPLLLARLEENKRLAKVKENEVLERYVNMEYMRRFNKPKNTNNHNIRIDRANSDSHCETGTKREKIDARLKHNTVVTEKTTEFMMPIISQTCSLSQIDSNINQITSNVLSPSSPCNQMQHPVVNDINPNPGIPPLIRQNPSISSITSKPLRLPLIYTIQSPSLTVSNGISNCPKNTIVPATIEIYPSQFINESKNNFERVVNNVATSNEIEDNESKIEVIENSFITLREDNIVFIKDSVYNKLVQNNLNDSNTSHMEVIENSTAQVQVKEENEIHESNDSLHNVNIQPNSNVIDTDNQITKKLTSTKYNYSNKGVDFRESIVATPHHSTNSVEETQIKEEPVDMQYSTLEESHEAQINSEENNVNTLQSNDDLTNINNKSIGSNEIVKIRGKSTKELKNATVSIIQGSTIESNENVQTIENVSVKMEAVVKHSQDIQRYLDGLGDNYVSTIFDIEDPFLVVEISSDSSSDEDL